MSSTPAPPSRAPAHSCEQLLFRSLCCNLSAAPHPWVMSTPLDLCCHSSSKVIRSDTFRTTLSPFCEIDLDSYTFLYVPCNSPVESVISRHKSIRPYTFGASLSHFYAVFVPHMFRMLFHNLHPKVIGSYTFRATLLRFSDFPIRSYTFRATLSHFSI